MPDISPVSYAAQISQSQAISNATAAARGLTSAMPKVITVMNAGQAAASNFSQSIGKGAITMENFGSVAANAAKKVAVWQFAIMAVYGVMKKFEEITDTWKELEVTLERIGITTGKVGDTLYSTFRKVADVAVEFGMPINETLTGMDLALRATAKFTNEVERSAVATRLLKDASILANITGMQYKQGIDIMVGSLRQSGMELDEGIQLLDKWVAVSKNAAVSVNDLSQGFAIMADAARSAGLTTDQVNGLIAAMSETVTLGPVEIGNSIRGLMSTLYNPGSIKLLQTFGVSVRDVNGEIRSFWDVLTQLSAMKEADVLDESSWLEIAKAAGAGQRRYAQFLALLNNWETAMRIAGISINAEGQALEANERIVATLTNTYDKFTASQRSLFMALGTQGGLIGELTKVIDFMRDVNDRMSNATDTTYKLATAVIFLAGAFAAAKVATLAWGWTSGGAKIGGFFGRAGGIKPEQIVGSKAAVNAQARYMANAATTGKANLRVGTLGGNPYVKGDYLKSIQDAEDAASGMFGNISGGFAAQSGIMALLYGLPFVKSIAGRRGGTGFKGTGMSVPKLPFGLTSRPTAGFDYNFSNRQFVGAGGIPIDNPYAGGMKGRFVDARGLPLQASPYTNLRSSNNMAGFGYGAAASRFASRLGTPSGYVGGGIGSRYRAGGTSMLGIGGSLALGGAAYGLTKDKATALGATLGSAAGMAFGPAGMVAGALVGGVIADTIKKSLMSDKEKLQEIFTKVESKYGISMAYPSARLPEDAGLTTYEALAEAMEKAAKDAPDPSDVLKWYDRLTIPIGGSFALQAGIDAPLSPRQAVEEMTGTSMDKALGVIRGAVTPEDYDKIFKSAYFEGTDTPDWTNMNQSLRAMVDFFNLSDASKTDIEREGWNESIDELSRQLTILSQSIEQSSRYAVRGGEIESIISKYPVPGGLREEAQRQLDLLALRRGTIDDETLDKEAEYLTSMPQGYATALWFMQEYTKELEAIPLDKWKEIQLWNPDLSTRIFDMGESLFTANGEIDSFNNSLRETILLAAGLDGAGEIGLENINEISEALIGKKAGVIDDDTRELISTYITALSNYQKNLLTKKTAETMLPFAVQSGLNYQYRGSISEQSPEFMKSMMDRVGEIKPGGRLYELAKSLGRVEESKITYVDPLTGETVELEGNTLAISWLTDAVKEATTAINDIDAEYNIPSWYKSLSSFDYLGEMDRTRNTAAFDAIAKKSLETAASTSSASEGLSVAGEYVDTYSGVQDWERDMINGVVASNAPVVDTLKVQNTIAGQQLVSLDGIKTRLDILIAQNKGRTTSDTSSGGAKVLIEESKNGNSISFNGTTVGRMGG